MAKKMEAMDMHACSCGGCYCWHHAIGPVAVALIGLAFLGGALGWWSGRLVELSWPVLLIIAGLMKAFGNRCGCC